MGRISKRIVSLIIVISMVLNQTYISGAAKKVNNSTSSVANEATDSLGNTSENTEDAGDTSQSSNTENTSQSNIQEGNGVSGNTENNSTILYEENIVPDMEISNDLTLTEDMTVGNLKISGSRTVNLNGYTLNVNGNLTFSSGTLNFNGGELHCNGDAVIEKSVKLNMSNVNDTLSVDGSLDIRSVCNLTTGFIYVKGNFTATKDFKASGKNKIVFCGQEKQIISISDGGCFETVELCNYSEDGVYIAYAFQCNKLIDNGCTINYADLNGVRGRKLDEDIEFDGLYYLLSDTLDLNGHKLTINGDLVQCGGTIYLNGGKLIVNGDYRVQTRKVDEDMQVTYEKSKGVLKMDKEREQRVTVTTAQAVLLHL